MGATLSQHQPPWQAPCSNRKRAMVSDHTHGRGSHEAKISAWLRLR